MSNETQWTWGQGIRPEIDREFFLIESGKPLKDAVRITDRCLKSAIKRAKNGEGAPLTKQQLKEFKEYGNTKKTTKDLILGYRD